MARMVVTGARPRDLMETFGYSAGQISRILGSPLFEAEVARLESQADQVVVDINEDLQLMSSRAIEVLDRELDGEDLELGDRKLRVQTAFGVLAMAGHSKKDQPLHLHKHEHVHVDKMSDEELYRDVIDMVEEDGSG